MYVNSKVKHITPAHFCTNPHCIDSIDARVLKTVSVQSTATASANYNVVEELLQVIRQSPDHLQLHYQLHLCHQALSASP